MLPNVTYVIKQRVGRWGKVRKEVRSIVPMLTGYFKLLSEYQLEVA